MAARPVESTVIHTGDEMTTLDDFMNEQAMRLAQTVERREGENLLRVIGKDKAAREDARTTAIVRLDMARQEINYQIGKAEKQAKAAILRMMDNVPHEGPGGFSPGPLDAVVGGDGGNDGNV